MAAFTVSMSNIKAAPAKVAVKSAKKSVRRAVVARAFGGDDMDMAKMELRTLKATLSIKEDQASAQARINELEAMINGGGSFAAPAAPSAWSAPTEKYVVPEPPTRGAPAAPAPTSFAAPTASVSVPSDSGAYGLEVRCNPTKPTTERIFADENAKYVERRAQPTAPTTANIFPEAYSVDGGFSAPSYDAPSWSAPAAPAAEKYVVPEAPTWGAPAAPAPTSFAAPAASVAVTSETPEELKMELRTLKATVGLKEDPSEANARIAAIEAALGGAPSAPAPAAAFGAPAPSSFGAPAAAPAGIPTSTAGMSEDEIMMLRCELKSAKATAGLSENPAEAQARVAALEKLLFQTAY